MIDVQDLCKKLKPVLGAKADRYWLAYLAEDASGKQEMAAALQLIAAQVLGMDLENPRVHLSVPHRTDAAGEYPIGTIKYAGKSLYPFGLRESEWVQHVGIFGRSGAGKTNTVFQLIQNLYDRKKPFLIFDWKRNYRDILEFRRDKMLVYTVGGKASPFAFNPLITPKGIEPAVWLKKLIEIIAHAYYLGEGVMYLFQEAFHAVYTAFGVYQGTNRRFPTFWDVLQWLEKHPVKGRKGLWMDSAMRAIRSICFGPMGKVVNTSVQTNVATLLEQNIVLELDNLTNADKTLIIESLLLWIHHYRLGESQRETFKHALIIEEAHHILARKTGSHSGETIIETVLREIRELGEAVVLVDQHPNMISPVALGNTYTTICMNLKHRSDVNAMGSAMLMDTNEREILGTLPIGAAVVKLQGRWQRPFQITIPHQQIKKGAVTDARLTQLMKMHGAADVLGIRETDDNAHSNKRAITLSSKEITILHDIYSFPYSGIVDRYRRLHWSRRKGHAIEEKCLVNNLIEAINVPTRTGKVVLLQLTNTGIRLLKQKGYQVKQSKKRESLIHEYWKQKAAAYFNAKGYTVSVEEPVNGFTDLVIEKYGRRFAVEIETGKSNWYGNMNKNLAHGFNRIILISTNDKIYNKLKALKEKNKLDSNVEIYRAQDFL